MNSLDIVILLIMAVALTVSTFRGGIREIFSLLAVIIGFLLAANFYHAASQNIFRPTSHDELNDIIYFLGIFIFAAVLISFIGGRLAGAVKKSKIKTWNVILGTVIGALKGLLVSCIIVYMLMVFLPANSRIFTKSYAFPYLSKVTSVISPIAPGFFREEFDKKLDEFKHPKEAPKPAPAPAPEKPQPQKKAK